MKHSPTNEIRIIVDSIFFSEASNRKIDAAANGSFFKQNTSNFFLSNPCYIGGAPIFFEFVHSQTTEMEAGRKHFLHLQRCFSKWTVAETTAPTL